MRKLLRQSSPCRGVKPLGLMASLLNFIMRSLPNCTLSSAQCTMTSFLIRNCPRHLPRRQFWVLLKKDKNPLDCGSYRPISLLCCDYKILTKVLSCSLETVMPNVINSDQTVFISGGQSFCNMHQLCNVLYSAHSTLQPEVVISLDAEKAFDRVDWEYLFTVLERFGFIPTFLSWIKTSYSSQVASVRTNNVTSSYFALHRGARQGCCLSPFLFDLAIEPLARRRGLREY